MMLSGYFTHLRWWLWERLTILARFVCPCPTKLYGDIVTTRCEDFLRSDSIIIETVLHNRSVWFNARNDGGFALPTDGNWSVSIITRLGLGTFNWKGVKLCQRCQEKFVDIECLQCKLEKQARD